MFEMLFPPGMKKQREKSLNVCNQCQTLEDIWMKYYIKCHTQNVEHLLFPSCDKKKKKKIENKLYVVNFNEEFFLKCTKEEKNVEGWLFDINKYIYIKEINYIVRDFVPVCILKKKV